MGVSLLGELSMLRLMLEPKLQNDDLKEVWRTQIKELIPLLIVD